MCILEGEGLIRCMELVEVGYTCTIMLEKVMVWLENGVQKHNGCGITNVIGAECMLYLQDRLL